MTSLVDIALSGRGLFMRPARLSDWQEWRALRMSSERYLAAREPMWTEYAHSYERYAARLVREAAAMAECKRFSFLIFSRGVLVGGVELGPVMDADKRRAFLGTWVGERHAGRGCALRAADVVCDFGFDDLRIESIDATVLPDNTPSIRVLRHLGFRRDNERLVRLTVKGETRSHHVYSLTKRQRDIRKFLSHE